MGGRRLAIRDLTVKERILLHLFEYNRFAGDYEAPAEVTQGGIAKAIGIRAPYVTQYVKPLISQGLVEEGVSHIKRKPRRRKTYFLTTQGKYQSTSLRGSLLEESIPCMTAIGEIRERTLSQVLQEERRGIPLLDLMEELRTRGHIAESKRPVTAGLAEVLEEAPSAEEFYGRQQEIIHILQAVERVPLVVVIGMAGIGKSTLAAKVCESLRGKRSLFWRSVRPWDTPTDLAQRLAGFMRQAGRDGLHAYLSGHGERETSRIEDLLASDLGEMECLLVLDDIQNASSDTQSFLTLIARVLYRKRGARALFLSRTAPEFYSRREVIAEDRVEEVTLAGLDPESSRALLRGAGYESQQLNEVVKATAGTPLFLKLIARSKDQGLEETRWDALEDYIAEEIEPTLAEEEHSLLETASFYSGPISEAGLLLDGRANRRTILDLHRRGLLERTESEGFVLHDFLRDFFQGNLTTTRRRAIVSMVVPWLQDEAEAARTGGRLQDAISHIENAIMIEVEPHRRLASLELLGDARSAVADFLGAVDTLRSALSEVDEDRTKARLHRKISTCLFLLRKLGETDAEIERGLQLLKSVRNLDYAWLLTIRANVAYVRADFDEASRDLASVTSLMPALPEDPKLVLWVAGVDVIVRSWYPTRKEWGEFHDEWTKLFEFAKAISDNPSDLYFPLLWLAISTVESGETEEGFEQLRRVVELGEAAGRIDLQPLALLCQGWCLLEFQGDYESAEASLERSLALFRDSPSASWRIPWCYRHFTELYWRQGRLEEARESLEYFLEITSLPTPSRIETFSLAVRLYAERGNLDITRAYLQEGMDASSGDDSSESSYSLEWAKATVAAREGEPENANSHFERALSLGIPPPSAPGNMIEMLATTRNPGELLLDFGRFLLAENKLDRAEEVLKQARDEFQKRNRKPLEEIVMKELRTLRYSPPA